MRAEPFRMQYVNANWAGTDRTLGAMGEEEEPGKMALAEQIAPHVPYLRRFSRALTGSQQSGDAYVEALLEAVLADPASISGRNDTKVALYALLCRLWESITVNLKTSEPSDHWERAAQMKLANIEPRPRQAFLLTAVEGFGGDEAASILETDAKGL